MRFQVAIDRPMKDHITSLHLTTDVFKISFNNVSALFSLTKERFEDEQEVEDELHSHTTEVACYTKRPFFEKSENVWTVSVTKMNRNS